MSEAATGLLLYGGFMVLAMSVLSLPLAPATLLAAKLAHPLAVAAIAGAAAAIASVFDHWFVRRMFRVDMLARVRAHRFFARAERWVARAPAVTTFSFAAMPVPFTVIRILAPLSGLSAPRYVTCVATGRFVRIAFIASVGSWLEIDARYLLGFFVASLAAAVVVALARSVRARSRAAAPAVPPTS